MSVRFFSEVISKIKRPICVECVHYIEYKHSNPYDELYDGYKLGKCSKFGEQNLVTGRIEYENAYDCRKVFLKCGEKGYHYKAIADILKEDKK